MGTSDSAMTSTMPDFSLAFRQMANFVAIAKTRNMSEVLDELVKQCFVILPDEPLKTSNDVADAVRTLFGIQLPAQDISKSVERLLDRQDLSRLPGDHLGLSPKLQKLLEERIAAARQLQEAVKQSWLSQVAATHPNLDQDRLWRVLVGYLGQAFRRHGIQAVTLLDPTAVIASQRVESLSPVLISEIKKEFIEADYDDAWTAVSSFFSTVGSDRKRAEYISQLADGAFNYFSLTIAPEVADGLRKKLNPMTLFLDTNFLFGILELHVNSQVDVSLELIKAVREYRFPFKLRYHQATIREMNNSLVYYGGELRRRKWSQAISRAAVSSERFSGIELRYHALNSSQSVDVEDFLSPFDHWDIILRNQEIDVYNPGVSESQLLQRAGLEADYRDYLKACGREKPHDAIQHDMAILQTVHTLRTNAKSSLDAGALLVTCDNLLFRFDLERSRRAGTSCCTVLPSLFWQLLRPFVSNGEDFDTAFAETFALPEFSLSRGDAAKAASKMLTILAGYGNLPEETAARMLANDILLKKLQTKNSDREYLEIIDAELAQVNEELMEEKAAAVAQYESERQQRKQAEQELSQKSKSLGEKEGELIEKERFLEEQRIAILEKEKTIQDLEVERERKEQQVRKVAMQVVQEQKAKEIAELERAEMLEQRGRAERQILRSKKTASVIVGILLAALFEILIYYVFRWDWLLLHPNSYGLQGCIIVMIISGVAGLWVKPWRNALWVTLFVGAGLVILQTLGGPSKSQ